MALLEVQNLKQYFAINAHFTVKAVDDVSFTAEKNEILSIVGESGSGKSTIAKTLMGYNTPTSGKIVFDGVDISSAKLRKEHKNTLSKRISIIFQDSASSLNPRMRVFDIIAEPLVIHKIYKDKKSLDARIDELLTLVGLNSTYKSKYPEECSGGQRQRVSIARSLALQPDLVIADEPIAALDVSIQAQIINLFKHLQEEHHFSFIFIAHDLSIVRFISDKVLVMYKGKLVEFGTNDDIFLNPAHEYTKSLLSAVPEPDPDREKNKVLLEFDKEAFNSDGKLTKISETHFVMN